MTCPDLYRPRSGSRNWYVEVRHDGRRTYAHRVICEKALGRPLPPGVEIHHVDENKANNSNRNLVICQDRKYHKLIEQRQRVLRAGGNPNTDGFCSWCSRTKPWRMFARRSDGKNNGRNSHCNACATARRRRLPRAA